MWARARMEDKALDKAVDAVQWVVGKALAPVTDGVLEVWEASKNLGLNVEALRTELLLVKATLEIASGKQLNDVPTIETLLQKLRDSAHDAEDLLDELDYFRIHDGLHGTYDAADEHVKGGVHNLVFNVCHTAKAVGKRLVSVCSFAASPGDLGARKRMRGNSSAAPNANQADEEASGWMPKLGKLLPRSFFPHGHDDDETQKLGFNRADVSERIKHSVEELRPMRTELTTILQTCGRNTVPDTSQSRLITTGQSIEPRLYGRDGTVNSIIHDITERKDCGRDLTVLKSSGSYSLRLSLLTSNVKGITLFCLRPEIR